MKCTGPVGLLEPSGSYGAGCHSFYPSALRKKTLHVSFYVWCLCCNVNKQTSFFYVHGTVHLSNTSHINTNEMQLFFFSFIWCYNSTCFGRSLHPSSGVL